MKERGIFVLHDLGLTHCFYFISSHGDSPKTLRQITITTSSKEVPAQHSTCQRTSGAERKECIPYSSSEGTGL